MGCGARFSPQRAGSLKRGCCVPPAARLVRPATRRCSVAPEDTVRCLGQHRSQWIKVASRRQSSCESDPAGAGAQSLGGRQSPQGEAWPVANSGTARNKVYLRAGGEPDCTQLRGSGWLGNTSPSVCSLVMQVRAPSPARASRRRLRSEKRGGTPGGGSPAGWPALTELPEDTMPWTWQEAGQEVPPGTCLRGAAAVLAVPPPRQPRHVLFSQSDGQAKNRPARAKEREELRGQVRDNIPLAFHRAAANNGRIDNKVSQAASRAALETVSNPEPAAGTAGSPSPRWVALRSARGLLWHPWPVFTAALRHSPGLCLPLAATTSFLRRPLSPSVLC